MKIDRKTFLGRIFGGLAAIGLGSKVVAEARPKIDKDKVHAVSRLIFTSTPDGNQDMLFYHKQDIEFARVSHWIVRPTVDYSNAESEEADIGDFL